jgi:pimeloyl-ACP methyl ester carboxylesterase
MTGVHVGHVDVDGRTLAYWRAGTGPPLVLLHGGWSDGREWWPQLDGLADEFDVIAWDAPGCGGSSDPPEDLGMDGFADAVGDLVAALELDRPHLGGLSFGGGLAIAVAQRHPDLARSLVLCSAYAGWGGSLPADEVAARLERALEEADRPPAEWVHGYLPGFFASPVDPAVTARVVEIMLDVRRAGIRSMLPAFAAADLRGGLGAISVPTLLLYGEADVRSPQHVAEELHAAIARSELVVPPGIGHVTNLEAPDRFNEVVRRFLRSVLDPA